MDPKVTKIRTSGALLGYIMATADGQVPLAKTTDRHSDAAADQRSRLRDPGPRPGRPDGPVRSEPRDPGERQGAHPRVARPARSHPDQVRQVVDLGGPGGPRVFLPE